MNILCSKLYLTLSIITWEKLVTTDWIQGHVGHTTDWIQGHVGHTTDWIQGHVGHTPDWIQGHVGHTTDWIQGHVGHTAGTQYLYWKYIVLNYQIAYLLFLPYKIPWWYTVCISVLIAEKNLWLGLPECL